MQRIIYLILGLFSLFEVGYHLARYNGEPGSIFGFDIPNIPYLLIWGGLGVLFLYRYYQMRTGKN